MERVSAIDVEYTLSPKFQLGIMRNVERELTHKKRKSVPNWKLVQDYLLGHTAKGGSTSCCQHCLWMGINPEGFTFFEGV